MGRAYQCESEAGFLCSDRHLPSESQRRRFRQRFRFELSQHRCICPHRTWLVAWPSCGRLPGIYKIGGYYNSSETPDLFKDINGQPAGLTGEPFLQHNGRWGGYIMADQMVFREESGSNRGLTLGAMVTAEIRTRPSTRIFGWRAAITKAPSRVAITMLSLS